PPSVPADRHRPLLRHHGRTRGFRHASLRGGSPCHASPRHAAGAEAGQQDPSTVGGRLMPALIFLAILAVVGVIVWLSTRNRATRSGGTHNDAPAFVVAAATAQLPAGQRDWGRAMAAELTEVQGRGRRWRFAAGVLRVVAFPPPRYPGR